MDKKPRDECESGFGAAPLGVAGNSELTLTSVNSLGRGFSVDTGGEQHYVTSANFAQIAESMEARMQSKRRITAQANWEMTAESTRIKAEAHALVQPPDTPHTARMHHWCGHTHAQ